MNMRVTGIILCVLSTSVLSVKNKATAVKNVKTTQDPKTTNVTTTAAPVKEKSQKELLGSFGIFGLSKSKDKSGNQKDAIVAKTITDNSPKVAADPPVNEHTKTPSNTVEQQCSSVDMCLTMNGICNHGKCVHTDPTCMNDIKCNCETGYTGQFCSTAIKDIPEITTTIEPTTRSTTPTTTTTKTTTTKHSTTTLAASSATGKGKDKQHVNGNVDTNVLGQHTGSASGNVNGNAIGSGVSTSTAKLTQSQKIVNDDAKASGKQDNNQSVVPGISVESGKGTTKSESSQGPKKSLKESMSIAKSYRKGAEASFVADNSPISLNTTLKPQEIKTGKVSIISTIQDIVTFATISVKNTFINVVKQQTPRVSFESASKSSKVNTADKTTKPEVTTLPAFTKVVIIDSSKNMTVNATSNVSIKKTDKTVVKKPNGSVEIKYKSVDTVAVNSSNMINTPKVSTSTKSDKGSKDKKAKKAKPRKSEEKKQKTNLDKKSANKNAAKASPAKATSKSKGAKNDNKKKPNNKNKNSSGQKKSNGTLSSVKSSQPNPTGDIKKLVAFTKDKLTSAV